MGRYGRNKCAVFDMLFLNTQTFAHLAIEMVVNTQKGFHKYQQSLYGHFVDGFGEEVKAYVNACFRNGDSNVA